MIIQDIELIGTSIDLVCIEESKEDEAKEHHFVEAQMV
jgi:hypothetical protein